MAQDISLLGAVYSDVPSVLLPKQGGGTAQFDDTTDADATASDILTGKTAYVNGVKVVGTNTGGSGDGYVWQDAQGYVHLSDQQGTQITVEALSATSNTTYTAPTGKAYSPVVVNVPTVTITQSGSNLSIV